MKGNLQLNLLLKSAKMLKDAAAVYMNLAKFFLIYSCFLPFKEVERLYIDVYLLLIKYRFSPSVFVDCIRIFRSCTYDLILCKNSQRC